jgi:hypothetical protein
MAAKQTPILLGRFVEHQNHFNSLPTEDAQWAIQNPKDAAALCITAIRNRNNGVPKTERTYRILQPVMPKPVERRPFNADETFFNKKSGVKMIGHGSNFKSWFGGKVEEDVPDGELRPLTLTQSANDSEIIADLGGETAAEVTLAETWRLMERQANGGEGALLNNGWANIFYVRDRDMVLRAVCFFWLDNGWRAFADVLGVGGRFKWDDRRRVFSRNS